MDNKAPRNDFTKKYTQATIEDLNLVGGKNASLGEMIQGLEGTDINFPRGFIITTHAFDHFLKTHHLNDKLNEFLDQLSPSMNLENIKKISQKIKHLIRAYPLPKTIYEEINSSYKLLCQETEITNVDVAIRSSATAEDLPEASFAGQHESFLNIRGIEAIVDACINCYASLFSERAIIYRNHLGLDHRKVKLSIGVQQMIRSDLSSSGVLFTLDTESGAQNVILINSTWGLGENIVKGRVDPDEFIVSKDTLLFADYPILKKKKGEKKDKLVYWTKNPSETTKTANVPTSIHERNSYSLSNDEIIKLSKWAITIEIFFSHHRKSPMDIEWAKDGRTNKLYIVQARPETVHSQHNILERKKLHEKGKILAKGMAIGNNIGGGQVRIIHSIKDLDQFQDGEVLVAEMTDPDWESVMKKASAIITSKGARTCHAAIISREHGVPCVVGVKNALDIFKPGEKVTVDGSQGEEGIIYQGILTYSCEKVDITKLPETKTKVKINLGHPKKALVSSILPVSGVGLARMEFIITEEIKIHPLALLKPESIVNQETKNLIKNLITGYEINPQKYFVEKLVEGISMIAGAFYPRPVILRFSDFKSNEYANLLGGEFFEPKEENPMMGLRGASRYYSDFYKEAFKLECEAIKFAYEKVALKNIILMVPFCRTLDEAYLVREELIKNRLAGEEQSTSTDNKYPKIYMMCEIPSNIILIEKFAELFDGFSIGSNDLTSLTLGIDRDSHLVSHIFNERNDAVKEMIEMSIKGSHKMKKTIGICGEAPSNYPDFLDFLIEKKIDSISLSQDSILTSIDQIQKSENKFYHQ